MLEAIAPAVVNISTESNLPTEHHLLTRDPLFGRFFGIPEELPERWAISIGSGVIVDSNHGYVITNYHLVQSASRIQVTLKDKRSFRAVLIGGDSGTDIAVLYIQAEGLIALPLADSNHIQVGDFALAIGNPFGLGQTITFGIISALGRTGLTHSGYENFIQTDASINPGNSGGALVTTSGQLIGINTAILSRSGGNIGIGFAVPSNTVRTILNQLIQAGSVSHPRLGVTIEDITPELAVQLNLQYGPGARIAQVKPGSAAEIAGLRQGDVIIAVDGCQIDTAGSLRYNIGLIQHTKKIALIVLRNGQKEKAIVRLSS
jgi:serine protease DegQ